MKKNFSLLLTFFVTIFFISCKKDATDIPAGTIKMDLNGAPMTYSVDAKAIHLNVSGGNGIQVQGKYRTGSTSNLVFTIAVPGSVTTGTYTENVAGNPLVSMTRCTELIFPCVYQAMTYGSVSNPLRITISSITPSSVKGTFSGELHNNSGDNESITNGAFHVNF